jgi:hypothetical protein
MNNSYNAQCWGILLKFGFCLVENLKDQQDDLEKNKNFQTKTCAIQTTINSIKGGKPTTKPNYFKYFCSGDQNFLKSLRG